ncbi:hypothetical protein HDV05_002427 [Chytridiales sp. JEL 0842]|nr:hypothetical protein HDV05_002427 [Chytridiales sp. JEL 0842]
MPTSTWPAAFVKSALARDDTRAIVKDRLARSQAYEERSFSAVAMIDISGYSSLTSNLSRMGKVSSEIITATVSDYLTQIIDVITTYGGDVVKFLGDAILVSFKQAPGESESDTVERATTCCLQISVEFSTIQINMEEALQQNNRINVEDQYKTSAYQKLNLQDLNISSVVTLYIHVAVTSGIIANVILGILDYRLDYCIHGPCLTELGDVLDDTKQGEIGLSKQTLALCSEATKRYASILKPKEERHYIVFPKESLPRFMEYFKSRTPERKASVISDTQIVTTTPESRNEYLSMLRLFINESLLLKADRKNKEGGGLKRMLTMTSERQTQPIGLLQSEYLTVSKSELQLAPTTGDRRTSSSTAREYETASQPITIQSEFRTVSIIFVKLKSTFTPERAQKAMVGFVLLLKQWEGVFQQYSVDDKPWTHEKDPLNALKAAVAFGEYVNQNKMVGEVSISVATGELLFSKLGNSSRSDASLLGDVVNVAARLLNIESSSSAVKCDKATYLVTKEDFTFSSLGAQKVKGKTEPIDVWSVTEKQQGSAVSAQTKSTTATFGYTKEKEMLRAAIETWKSTSAPQKIVVEGKSGIGKSKLIDFLIQEANGADLQYCLTQGSEIKQFTPYFAIQNIMYTIFRKYADETLIQPLENSSITNDYETKESSFFSGRSSKTSLRSKGRSASHNIMFTSRQELTHFVRESVDSTTSPYPTAVKSFLTMMGENPSMAPLLTDILPFLTITDTAFTKNMDAQARSALLKSMVVRMVNKAMAMEGFMLIFDDCQWFDAMSLDIIQSILKGCPNSMTVFFCRPIAELKLTVMEKIVAMPDVGHYVLTGLDSHDVQEILVHMFAEFGVKRISEGVMKIIMDITLGLPLSVDTIGQAIKSQFSQVFRLDSAGVVYLLNDESEAKIGSMSSVSSSVMLQFDRLDHDFQMILRKASIFGQYLNLEDLHFFFKEDFESPKEMDTYIQQNDTYQYLIKHSSSDDDENFAMYFRHIQIMLAIYDSLPFASRSQEHLSLATYFESALNDANREFLLPIVTHHYRKTNNLEKQVLYLEELGVKHFKQAHQIECENRIQALLDLVETDKAKKEKAVLKIESVRHAYWLVILATVHLFLFKYGIAEVDLCKKSLALLGTPWPGDVKEGKKVILKTGLGLWKLWKKTKGGTRPLPPSVLERWGVSGKKGSSGINVSDQQQRYQIRLLNYRCLFRLSIYTTTIPKELKLLILLSMLHTVIPWGYQDKFVWCGILYTAAFGLSWSVVPLSKVYFSQSIKVETLLNDVEREQLLAFYHVKALGLQFRGKLEESVSCFRQMMKFHQLRGDQSSYNMGMHGMHSCLRGLGGCFDIEPEIFQILKEPDSYQLPLSVTVAACHALVDDFPYLLDRFQLAKKLTDAVKISLNDPPIAILQSWISFHEADYNKALDHYETVSHLLGPFRQYYGLIMDTYIDFAPLTWMMLHPLLPGPQKEIHVWTPAQRRRIIESIKRVLVAVKFYAVKCQWVYFSWTLDFLQAALGVWEGQLGKGIKVLTAGLKDSTKVGVLEEVPYHKAVLHAILALYGGNEADRRHYFESATGIFRRMGYTRLERWVVEVDGALRGRA